LEGTSFFDFSFDIDFGATPEMEECDPCDWLLVEMEVTAEDVIFAQEDLEELMRAHLELQMQIDAAQKELESAEKALEDFTNPKSWVESEGRRLDSSDLQVIREHSGDLWNQYKNGDLTAQELSDAWGTDLTEAERAALKAKAQKRLEDAVDAAKKKLEALKDQLAKLEAEIDIVFDDVMELLEELGELQAQYNDCIKRCQEREVIDIPKDYGIDPNGGGFFDWIRDLFSDLFGGGEEEDDSGERPVDPLPDGGMDPFDFPPFGGGESTDPEGNDPFGLDFDFNDLLLPSYPPTPTLPEVLECLLCDPILDEIYEAQAEADAVLDELEAAQKELRKAQAATEEAQRAQAAAEKALNDFNNPRSSAESEGRRLDSSDLEVIRSHNRSLWNQYRNGDLSAQELSDAWGETLSEADREALKAERRLELQAEIDAAKASVKAAQEAQAGIEVDVAALKEELAVMDDKIAELLAAYEECLKLCQEVEEDNVEELIGKVGEVIEKEDEPDEPEEGGGAEMDGKKDVGLWCEWFPMFCGKTDVEYGDEWIVEEGTNMSATGPGEEEKDDDDEEDDEDVTDEEGDGTANGECTVGTDADRCGFACEVDCRLEYKRPNGKGCYTCPDIKDLEVRCDSPTMEQSSCKSSCPRLCELTYTRANGNGCYTCPTMSDECKAPYVPMADCKKTCSGTCENAYTTDGGTECVKCEEVLDAPRYECDAPTSTLKECSPSCSGNNESCEKSYTRKDGVDCYECKKKTTTVVPPKCATGTSELAACEDFCEEDGGSCVKASTRSDGVSCYRCEENDDVTPPPSCPSDTSSLHDCQEMCPGDGSCMPVGGDCYRCQVLTCPNGSTKNSCPTSCPNGCDIAAQEGSTICYKCKQSCEDVCADNDFSQVGIDWSNYIESYISEYSCVSGASISLQTATIGSCSCSNQPSISINTIVPVCKGTPCGDVMCGQSTSCAVEGGTTTVNCRWSGWQKVDVNKFAPVIGQ
jgi:hypothetical protein